LQGAPGHHVIAGAHVANHAHALARQKHCESLAGGCLSVFGNAGCANRFAGRLNVGRGTQFLHKDSVDAAQQVGVFLFHLAQNPHS